VLENSDVAVALPASVSFASEAQDNQARSYHQSRGECFSLSWGRGRGEGEQDTRSLGRFHLGLGARKPPERPHGVELFIIAAFGFDGR